MTLCSIYSMISGGTVCRFRIGGPLFAIEDLAFSPRYTRNHDRQARSGLALLDIFETYPEKV